MKTQYNRIFIDVETTGLDPKINNIFQLSGIIADPELNILEKFDYKFRPFDLDNCEPAALEKTGMTLDELQSLPMDYNEAFNQFTHAMSKRCNRYDKTDKFQMIAYNAPFDSGFLREFFTKNNDNYFGSWFWNPPICVMQASAWALQDQRADISNFKLATLCKLVGIDWDETQAHNAMYDIHKTYELYKSVWIG